MDILDIINGFEIDYISLSIKQKMSDSFLKNIAFLAKKNHRNKIKITSEYMRYALNIDYWNLLTKVDKNIELAMIKRLNDCDIVKSVEIKEDLENTSYVIIEIEEDLENNDETKSDTLDEINRIIEITDINHIIEDDAIVLVTDVFYF